jgi:hypothetical protein
MTVFGALGLALGALPLLIADRADAAYSDGGSIVLGNFSQGAYGSGVDHRDAPREEPRRWVRTAALAPSAYAPKRATTAAKSVTAPRKEDEGTPPALPPRGLSDEQEQALLIEKSLVAVAYVKRKQEANQLWTCMHESGKQLLAHIEAEFGSVDISEGTCAKRNIAGTGTQSQHAYGRAIDFLPSKGHSKQQIVTWLTAHRDEGWVSGIMTYATMSHIHVDTGPYHFVALNAR